MVSEMWKERVLTAEKRYGEWHRYDPETYTQRPDYGEFWTVVDRDTGELIGAFGMMVQEPTCGAALAEAERIGSKWGWPTDREAVREVSS